jgi:hypothetical protein
MRRIMVYVECEACAGWLGATADSRVDLTSRIAAVSQKDFEASSCGSDGSKCVLLAAAGERPLFSGSLLGAGR